jgi:hypothetical protein
MNYIFKCVECNKIYYCNRFQVKYNWFNPGSKPLLPGLNNLKKNKENYVNTCPDGCIRKLECGHNKIIKSKKVSNSLIECDICNYISLVYYTWNGIMSENEFNGYFN